MLLAKNFRFWRFLHSSYMLGIVFLSQCVGETGTIISYTLVDISHIELFTQNLFPGAYPGFL